jgi:hypothetical protein
MQISKIGVSIGLSILSCVALLPPTRVHGQAEIAASIGVSELMNGVVDNLRNSLTALLDKIDNSVSSSTYLARMNLQILLSDLEFRSKEVIGKSFSELNNSQKVFFSNLRTTVRDFEALGDKLTENGDMLIQRGELMLSLIPFADKEPRLLRNGPRVITDNFISSNKRIDLTFNGSFMVHAKPELELEGKKCDLKKSSDVALTFNCDLEAIQTRDKAAGQYRERLDGKLDLALQRGFWSYIKGIFSTDIESKEYSVSLAVVPHVIGSFTATVVQVNSKTTGADRTLPFDSGARHCVSGSSRHHNISPQGAGWSIDPNSVRTTQNSCNNGGAVAQNVTTQGFQILAWGNNRGSCGPFGIKDARGWCNGTIHWREQREDPAPTKIDLPPVAIAWGDQRVISLPERSQSFVGTMRMFDGRIFEFNSNSRNDFISFDVDAGGTAITIAPVEISRAFK